MFPIFLVCVAACVGGSAHRTHDAASGDAAPLRALLDGLHSSDVFTRRASASALAKRKEPESVTGLADRLAIEDDLEVRRLLVGGLIAIQDDAAVPTLIEVITKDRVEIRALALVLTSSWNHPRLQEVALNATWDNNSEVRAAAFRSILMAKTPPDSALARRGLADAVAGVREEALSALSARKPAPIWAADLVAARIREGESEPAIRKQLAQVLGRLGSRAFKAHEQALMVLLSDPDLQVRSRAVEAVGLVGSSHAVSALKELLAGEEGKVNADQELLRLAAEAIDRLESASPWRITP